MARYYASRSGRFMTPDPRHVGAFPEDPKSWNAYVYAGNDPVNFVDPDGLEKKCPEEKKQGQICVDVEGSNPSISAGGGAGFDFGWWPSFDEWTDRVKSHRSPLSWIAQFRNEGWPGQPIQVREGLLELLDAIDGPRPCRPGEYVYIAEPQCSNVKIGFPIVGGGLRFLVNPAGGRS
jgi:hypothetical protein